MQTAAHSCLVSHLQAIASALTAPDKPFHCAGCVSRTPQLLDAATSPYPIRRGRAQPASHPHTTRQDEAQPAATTTTIDNLLQHGKELWHSVAHSIHLPRHHHTAAGQGPVTSPFSNPPEPPQPPLAAAATSATSTTDATENPPAAEQPPAAAQLSAHPLSLPRAASTTSTSWESAASRSLATAATAEDSAYMSCGEEGGSGSSRGGSSTNLPMLGTGTAARAASAPITPQQQLLQLPKRAGSRPGGAGGRDTAFGAGGGGPQSAAATPSLGETAGSKADSQRGVREEGREGEGEEGGGVLEERKEEGPQVPEVCACCG